MTPFSQLKFINLGKEKKLSSLKITDLFQDSYGFVWIGTNYGLNCFNGYECKQYFTLPNDTSSISGNYISFKAFAEDEQGNIWIATFKNGLNFFNRKTEEFQHFNIQNGVLNSNEILALVTDENEGVWLATSRGLNYFNPDTGQSKTWYSDGEFLDTLAGSSLLMSLEFDRNGLLWIGTNRGLSWFDPKTEEFNRFPVTPSKLEGISSPSVFKIYEGNNGRILIGTNNGLNLWNEKEKTFLKISPSEAFSKKNTSYDYILEILEEEDGRFWLGTLGGLLLFDSNTKTFQNFPHNANDPFSIQKGSVNTIMKDLHGNLWLGTDFGISILNKTSGKLNLPGYETIQNNFSNITKKNGITALLEVNNTLWFTSQKGLFLHKKGQEIKTILKGDFSSLFYDERMIYAGTVGNGFFTVDTNNFQLIQHFLPIESGKHRNKNRVKGNRITSFAKDVYGFIWIGANGGLNRFDPISSEFLQIYPKNSNPKSLSHSTIQDLLIDKNENLWVATLGGLDRLSVAELAKSFQNDKLHFEHFQYKANTTDFLSSNTVFSIFEDSKSNIWVGTETGLNLYNPLTGKWKWFFTQNGLPENKIVGITEDESHNIWLSTAQEGISVFNPTKVQFLNYSIKDGLNSNLFNTNTILKLKNGLLVFGGQEGISILNPNELLTFEKKTAPLYLTDFQILNQSVQIRGKDSLLRQPIYMTDYIEIEFKQKVISFQFTALDFIHPEKILYRYRLDSFHENWQLNGNSREITFTNLFPGLYKLNIEYSINGYDWIKMKRPLQLRILLPWFLKWWAFLIYFGIISSIFFSFQQYDLKRKLAKAEAIRLKEIDLAKSWFYTKITHEFRTPLTVILGMAEQVKSDPKKWFNEGLQLIQRNGKQLLGLINQLLDLSKFETENMPLHLVNGDIVSSLQFISESFHSYADSKDIRVHFITNLTKFYMDYDTEKLQNVVSNLLSNAIKFTPAGGNIYIDLRLGESEEKSIQLQIKDDGMGIENEYLPHIFDRFYQVDASLTRRGEGTGIGLALTKELIKVMGGHIEVESKMGKGTSFTIVLPITQKAIKQELEKEPDLSSHISEHPLSYPEKGQSINQRNRNWVLLVEDNKDVLTYLTSFLSNDYNIVTAKDGQEGIDKALESIPDLIVSDIMMPKKDGFELCATIKANERTSHIPIILLTAKSDHASRMVGLQQGADAYLSKPFNKEELLIRIEKLIALRSVLQKRFQTGKFSQLLKNPTQTKSEAFLKKVLLIIENKLSDENFGMPQLCKELKMERTHLFRKLIAITGLSATRLIRSMRLEKAKELLETTHLNVSEVCFEVGFSSPSYFSREFKKEFGLQPSAINKP